jgi:hypothetical protein
MQAFAKKFFKKVHFSCFSLSEGDEMEEIKLNICQLLQG